jgi:hypothetical protein
MAREAPATMGGVVWLCRFGSGARVAYDLKSYSTLYPERHATQQFRSKRCAARGTPGGVIQWRGAARIYTAPPPRAPNFELCMLNTHTTQPSLPA